MLTVEQWPIDKLIPYARNPRKNDEQVDRMASAIQEFGFRIPIVARSDGSVVDGHLRLKAARKLGLTEVPVALADDLTTSQVKAFRLLANQSANWAEWDTELLKLELEELKSDGYDMEMTGFDDGELLELTEDAGEGLTDPDEVPSVEYGEAIISRPGDIWILGGHRLMCGDSTKDDMVSKLLNGASVDTQIYDPPYDAQHLWFKTPDTKNKIVFSDFLRISNAIHQLKGYENIMEFIWDGQTSWYVPGRPLARHKTALVGMKSGKWDFDRAAYKDGKDRESKKVSNTRGEYTYTPMKDGFVHLSTVFSYPNTAEKEYKHSKPVQWVSAILLGCGAASVIDYFGGSGTCIVCCEYIGAKCFCMEIEPKNCDIIIKRWQNMTGKKAINEATNQEFSDIVASGV